MNYLTREAGKAISNQLPLQVDDVMQASDRISVSAETVTFASAAAASSTGVNALDKAPVLNLTGDKVGSFWGEAQNLVYSVDSTTSNNRKIGTLTETATAATVVITDQTYDLEKAFEIASGNRRFILKAYDDAGNILYGWIGGIANSSNAYTIDCHNAVTGGAKTWVGSTSAFDGTAVKIEIFSYQSSFTWTTGTVLTREVQCPKEEILQDPYQVFNFLNGLTAGDYAINYRTGAIYFKKATTGTSDTANYNSMATASVTISGGGTATTLADDSAFTVGTSQVTPAGFLADETSTDSVNEGDVGAARITLDRKQINASEHIDDAALAGGAYGTVISARADEAATDSVDEGDSGYLRMTLDRRLITASNILDDAALGVGTSYVTPIAGFADETSPDSVDEGDVGAIRMTLDRKLHIASTQVHDDAASNYASMAGLIAKNVDGTALPNPVGAENDIVRAAGTLSGVALNMLVTEDGAATAMAVEDAAIGAASGDAVVMAGAEARTYDGSALPNNVSEGDASRLATTEYGVQYNFLTNADGSWTPLDSSSQSIKTTEQSPVNQQYLTETLIDTTNVAAATNYYPSSSGGTIDGYKHLHFGGQISGGVTATIEASDDGTDWYDISKSGYDLVNNTTGTASWVDTNFCLDFDDFNMKYWRIKSVTADATNSVQINVRRSY